MGLDMYLYAEKNISQYDYETKDGKMSRVDNPEYDKANAFMSNMPNGEYGGITITKCVAYWRKANAVHGWIVRNCANGVDECQRIYMSREDLLKLREACHIGLKTRDNAEPDDPMNDTIMLSENDLTDTQANVNNIINIFANQMSKKGSTTTVTEDNPIPPTMGFFFGGSAKDEYYYQELAETIETINTIIASDPNEIYEYYYRASW